MDAPSFVCTTYIRTTPERLWQGLTDPAFTRRYWQTELRTDWAEGSPITWDNHGVVISDPRVSCSHPSRTAACPTPVQREFLARIDTCQDEGRPPAERRMSREGTLDKLTALGAAQMVTDKTRSCRLAPPHPPRPRRQRHWIMVSPG